MRARQKAAENEIFKLAAECLAEGSKEKIDAARLLVLIHRDLTVQARPAANRAAAPVAAE